MIELTISGTCVRGDSRCRFSLKDLHRASGGEKRHSPSYWLAAQKTKEYLKELAITGIPVVMEERGGDTYLPKELVYAYAIWVSPAFYIKVIRAYDKAMTAPAYPMALLENPHVLRELLIAIREGELALESTGAV